MARSSAPLRWLANASLTVRVGLCCASCDRVSRFSAAGFLDIAVSHATFWILRTLHLYLGTFAAPALFFMALTGGLQVFSLHETSRGSSYVPPAWLASAARLRKKQTLMTRPSKAPAALRHNESQAAAGARIGVTGSLSCPARRRGNG